MIGPPLLKCGAHREFGDLVLCDARRCGGRVHDARCVVFVGGDSLRSRRARRAGLACKV